MLKINKRFISITLITVMFSPSLVAGALTTVTGYSSINNSSEASYKTSTESMNDVINSINRPSDFKEVLNYSEAKKIIDSNPELSYLVENDILSYDVGIEYDRNNLYNPIKTQEASRFDFTSNETISKSDFMSTLAKAVYGVQESRYLVFSSKSIRELDKDRQILDVTSTYKPVGYSGEDDSFDFSRGDYNIYVSPNVNELYYKTLVSKGVVSLSEFSDINFINSIQSYGTNQVGKKVLPSWDPSLGYYSVNSANDVNQFVVEGSSPFGNGFELVEDGTIATLSHKEHSWFLDEKLLTIDALRYIEKALRLTEKEMTKTEAQLVNYKYGAKFLDRVDESSKDTVMFLVAKGVLNFENDDEFSNLYKELTGDFFRTLMYRVHNKNARFDFSAIQLTDGDNYWLSRGFYENEINFFNGVGASFDTEVVEHKEEVNNRRTLSNLFGLIKRRDVTIAEGELEYDVTRKFNNRLTYYYKGEKIKASNKPKDEITAISTEGENILVVKFKVKARNAAAAVAMIDANMSTSDLNTTRIGSIPAVSSVVNGKVTETFVSQTALRKMSGLPILVLNDKYLINKDNGSRALLLEDNRVAIVGNEIIRTDKTIVEGINGEVYYNMDIISKLLTQGMISSLDPSNVYLLPANARSKEKEYVVKSSNGVDGQALEKIYGLSLRVDPIVTGVSNSKVNKEFYNITLTNSTGNFLIQNISDDIGSSKGNSYMIVEFNYILPDSSSLPVNNTHLNKVISGDLTMGEVYGNLYKRPNNSSLASLWDSNIMMSNSIVNYMMGTVGLNYIKSGFIVPKVTILSDDGSEGSVYSIKRVNDFFLNKVKISSSLINNYGSYDSSKPFVQNYFAYLGTDEVSSNDSVIDEVKSRRTLEVIGYKKEIDKNSGYRDYSKFAVLDTGQVYKSIESSPQLEIDGNNLILKSKSSTIPKVYPGVSYTVKDNKNSNLKNFIVTKTTSGGVVDLVSMSPVELKYSSKSKEEHKLVYKDGSGNEMSYLDYINDLRKEVMGIGSSFKTNSSNFSGDINFINPKEPGVYFSEGTYYKVEGPDKKVILDLKDDGDLRTVKNSIIKVFPKFQTRATIYYPNNLNELVKVTSNKIVLDIGNLVNSGIASQIVDSIVYENSNYVTYSELPQNSTVYIGDVSYKKSGDFLQSGVLNNSDVISELSSTDLLSSSSKDSINTAVVKTLGGISLYNRAISSDVKFGASEVPLGQYIVDAKIGNGVEGSDYNNTLKMNDKGKLVITSFLSSNIYQSGSSFSSYCIAFRLDNSVRFRAIDDSNTKFTLVRVINKSSDGFLENVPYFMESLDYEDIDGLNADMLKSKFKPSDNAGELMEKFLEAYRWNTQRDLKELAKYWIRLICTVLSVTNLLTVMFRRSPLDIIVRDIKYSPGSRRNIDIYQIFTCGFQTVESHVPIWKGVLVSGVLVAIASFATIGPI